jgi:hypothetical protein
MSTSSISARSSLDSLRDSILAESIQSLPDALAPAVAGPMVWEGSELRDYIVELDASEVQAIRSAIIHFKCES